MPLSCTAVSRVLTLGFGVVADLSSLVESGACCGERPAAVFEGGSSV